MTRWEAEVKQTIRYVKMSLSCSGHCVLIFSFSFGFFQAGKMAKDLFIKELKFVVGNEMLQYAISEIQSSN